MSWPQPWYKDWLVWGTILLSGLFIALIVGLFLLNAPTERACKGQILEVQDGRGWVCLPTTEAP